MKSSTPRAKAGLQTQLESQKRVDNEILESPIKALGESIIWLIYFTEGDTEAAKREAAWLGTSRKWVMEHTLSSMPPGFSYLLSTQSPSFQDILIFSLIFLFQMLGDRQVTGPVADFQTLPTFLFVDNGSFFVPSAALSSTEALSPSWLFLDSLMPLNHRPMCLWRHRIRRDVSNYNQLSNSFPLFRAEETEAQRH